MTIDVLYKLDALIKEQKETNHLLRSQLKMHYAVLAGLQFSVIDEIMKEAD